MSLSKRFEFNRRRRTDGGQMDERAEVLEKTRELLELQGNRVLRQSARKVGNNWIVKVEIIAHPSFSVSDDHDFNGVHMDIVDRAVPIPRGSRMR